jgi:chemotaxis protein MotB
MKKGFRDPKDTEMAAGPRSRESSPEADTNQSLAETREVVLQPGAKMPTRSESTLFRDPYAVLGEIAADGRPSVKEDEKPKAVSGSAETATANASPDTSAIFSDPFATIPRDVDSNSQSESPSAPQQPASAPLQKDHDVPAFAHDAPPTRPDTEHRARATSAAASAPQANDVDVARLKSEIAALVKQDARPGSGPQIEVQSTSEGILISLTDDQNFSMFAVGSAEPQAKTVEVVARIGALLKSRPGVIVIRGYTDGRPFKSLNYDNWRLSAARAHMAHYMLIRGGLDEQRIEKIEGYADRQLKFPRDPMAPGNRRIEVLLRKEKS